MIAPPSPLDLLDAAARAISALPEGHAMRLYFDAGEYSTEDNGASLALGRYERGDPVNALIRETVREWGA